MIITTEFLILRYFKFSFMFRHLKIVNTLNFLSIIIIDCYSYYSHSLQEGEDKELYLIRTWLVLYKLMKSFTISNFNPCWVFKCFNFLFIMIVLYVKFRFELNPFIFCFLSFDLIYTYTKVEFTKQIYIRQLFAEIDKKN